MNKVISACLLLFSMTGCLSSSDSEEKSTSISLNWQAPTLDVEDNSIPALSGYKIYYGTEPNNYDDVIEVNDGSASSVTITDLNHGEYYFSMIAISEQGIQSAMSNEFYLLVN